MRRLSFMVTILIAFVLVNIKVSEAQRTFPSNTKPNLRMDSQITCWGSSSFALTEAQKKEFENLQRAYSAEAMPLRRELISLRFELRYLILDPTVQAKILLDRQKKISELQGKLENLSLSYQIKARSIFTKKQLEQLPPDFSMGMGTGFGIELGRGPRSGLRQQGK